jgi:low affinity Fe/Cu permease
MGLSADVKPEGGVFRIAVLISVGWASAGPRFGFGDTWQLVSNTGTTIVPVLMVVLIQNTQNRRPSTRSGEGPVLQKVF